MSVQCVLLEGEAVSEAEEPGRKLENGKSQAQGIQGLN